MASINIKERTSTKGINSFQVQVRGKGVEKPYSKSFSTSEDAQKWADEQDAFINGVTDVIQSPVLFTVASVMGEYLEDTQYQGGKRKKGYVTIESRLNILARGFGPQDISVITRKM